MMTSFFFSKATALHYITLLYILQNKLIKLNLFSHILYKDSVLLQTFIWAYPYLDDLKGLYIVFIS